MPFIGRIPRPDGVTPLSDGDIRRLAPSALATEAHESRSACYAYIPTAEVIAGMRANGFLPMAAAQARARAAGRAGHGKHMLRFRHIDAQPIAERCLGATFPEIDDCGLGMRACATCIARGPPAQLPQRG